MDELIEAFQIFLKYDNPTYPTNCEHDILHVYSSGEDEYHPEKMKKEDVERLHTIGFNFDYHDLECWYSFRYGSC